MRYPLPTCVTASRGGIIIVRRLADPFFSDLRLQQLVFHKRPKQHLLNRMNSKVNPILLILAFCAIAVSSKAGFFSDDPVQMSLTWKPNLLSKDQVLFAPAGKHEDVFLLAAEYTVEVKYRDHTSTFKSQQSCVAATSPLVITLSEGIKGIQAVSLKAKWRRSVLINRLKKNAPPLPPNPTPKQLADSVETLQGLKVDSRWTIQ